MSTTDSKSCAKSVAKPVAKPEQKKKTHRRRCDHCSKRLTLFTLSTCRCNGVFCGHHRLPFHHECNYDFKTAHQDKLRLENPEHKRPKLIPL